MVLIFSPKPKPDITPTALRCRPGGSQATPSRRPQTLKGTSKINDRMSHLLAQADAAHLPLPNDAVDMIFCSPPYTSSRLYLEDGQDLGIALDCADWVAWMVGVVKEATRVCRGPVVVVAAGKTEGRNYWPACEGLMWEWWKSGGHAYRPCYWHRVGIPGSGGDQWFRADVEYVMAFKRPGKLPWSDNTAMGEPCKYKTGGQMSYRNAEGNRRNKRTGTRLETATQGRPEIANPGNLVRVSVGGGQLGSNLSHLNEAPFPAALVEHFIRSLCPPGGIVLDMFSGSGTTVATALRHGRRGIGLDLRMSQCRLGKRRVAETLGSIEAEKAQLRLF